MNKAWGWILRRQNLLRSIAILAGLSSCNFPAITTAHLNTSVIGISSLSPVVQTPATLGDLSGEQAVQADAFVDSIGVTTHFNYTDTFYGTQLTKIRALLISSGIRHIRDGGPNQSQGYYDILNGLYAEKGIRTIGGVGIGNAASLPTLVNALITAIPSIEGIESLNEYDSTGPQWAEYLRSYQPLLYAAVKANPKTASLPVIGPSMGATGNSFVLGSVAPTEIANNSDMGNLHNYYAGHNPGSSGWGDDGYGSIPYCLRAAQQVTRNKPVWTTETGYYTGSTGFGASPDDINARYTPRLLLEQFNAGFGRTYLYQFAAEGADQTTSDGGSFFGLVDGSQNPKPQYASVKNLISILSDRGAPFTPGKLNYTLTGNTANVHHALFQKRDGSFYLVLWIEAAAWDALGSSYIAVAPQNIAIVFGISPSQITQSQFSNSGEFTNTHVTISNKTAALVATDQISVIQISK